MPARLPSSRLAVLLAGAALTAGLPAAAWAQPTGGAASQPAAAQPAAAAPSRPAPNTLFTGADIEAATYPGQGDLPPGRSALTAKVQMLLDRAGVSPGVTDGFKGGMSDSAIRAFERKLGLPVDGHLDPEVWAQLQTYAGPATQSYTITPGDVSDLVPSIPTDYAEKAVMERLGYTSLAEKLGERFHMDEKFLGFLNPGIDLAPGSTITVMAPAKPLKGEVTRIIVDKSTGRVAAYGPGGKLVADYPATIGSTDTPSPSGTHKVEAVALNPNYTYNPAINFKQGDNDKVLTIPPGPNGPVGTVWIDLDKPTYGIHGTPTPSQLFRNQSYGCVRLTNWDAEELAHMVRANVTVVEFLDPGVSIADVTDPVAPPVPLAGSPAEAVASTGPAAAAAPPAGLEPVAVPPAEGVPAALAPAPVVVPQTADPAGDPLAAAIQEATTTTTAPVAGAAPTAGATPTAGAAPMAGAGAVAAPTSTRPIPPRRRAPAVPAATEEVGN